MPCCCSRFQLKKTRRKKNKKKKKKKRRKSNNNTKRKPNRLSVFPIQRSAQHAAGQQSSRMLYKSAISMSSKGSAGWTKVHSSHCSQVMLASREQNIISKTLFPVIFWSQRAHTSTSVPCCKPKCCQKLFWVVRVAVLNLGKKQVKVAAALDAANKRHRLPHYPCSSRQCCCDNSDAAPSEVQSHTCSRLILYTAEAIYRSTCLHRVPHILTSSFQNTCHQGVGLGHRFRASPPLKMVT